MNFFGGIPNINHSELSRLRKKSTDTVQQKFPNAKFMTFDRSVIDVPFFLSNNSQLTFRVLLPQYFPYHPPTVLLLCKNAPHPLIDDKGVIVDPLVTMEKWGGVNTNLGFTLTSVFQKFQTNPPLIISYDQPAVQDKEYIVKKWRNKQLLLKKQKDLQNQKIMMEKQKQQQLQQQRNFQNNNNNNNKIQKNPPKKQFVLTENDFEEMNKLSELEKKELCDENNKKYLLVFIEDLKSVKNAKQLYLDLNEQNKKTAENICDIDSNMRKAHQQLQERIKILQKHVKKIEMKEKEKEKILNKFDKKEILKNIAKSINENEKECEDIVDKHLDEDKMNVKEFIKEYMESRTNCNQRKVKKKIFEKMEDY